MNKNIRFFLFAIPFLIALSGGNAHAMAVNANRAQERAQERYQEHLQRERQQFEQDTIEERLEIERRFQGRPEEEQQEAIRRRLFQRAVDFQHRIQEEEPRLIGQLLAEEQAAEAERNAQAAQARAIALQQDLQNDGGGGWTFQNYFGNDERAFLKAGAICFIPLAAYLLYKWMSKEANPHINKALIGKEAVATTTIRSGQKGEIILNGEKIAARTQHFQTIYAGTSVKIIGKGWSQTDGNYVIVQNAASPASI